MPGGAPRRRRRAPAESLGALSTQRRKLLELYYGGRITAEFFHEEEQRLTVAIEAARAQASQERSQEVAQNELELRFEQVVAVLRDLNIEELWEAAEEKERRVLLEELLEWVTVYPDHLEVTVAGAPPLTVLYSEVGLKEAEIVRVGEGT